MLENINKALYAQVNANSDSSVSIVLKNNETVLFFGINREAGTCNVAGQYDHYFENVKFKDINAVIVFTWYDSDEIMPCSIEELVSAS
ncbi:MAG: hypothetical protein ACRC3J_05040 [Culicoidibacterales bacterium]